MIPYTVEEFKTCTNFQYYYFLKLFDIWEDHEANPLGRDVKEHVRCGSNLRQPE